MPISVILRCGWFVCYEDKRSLDGLFPARYFETHDEACDWILANSVGVGGRPLTWFLEPGYAQERVA